MADTKDVASASLKALDTETRLSRREQIVRSIHLGAYASGLSAVTARRSSPSATVLMYHSVPEPHEEPWTHPGSCHRPDLFERQMKFLARHRNVISMERLVEMLENEEPFERGTVAITFDDGYRNNFRMAAPILARYDLPATVYLATESLDRGENQWIDTLYSTLRARGEDALDLSDLHADLGSWDLAQPGQAEDALGAIGGVLIDVEAGRRDLILEGLRDRLAPTVLPPRMTLDWEEVRTMMKDFPSITVGVHTANHIDLRAYPDMVEREAKACIDHMESETGQRPEHFAFPYNRHDEGVEAEIARHFRSSVGEDPTDPVVRPGHSTHGIRRLGAPWSMALLRSFTDGGYPDAAKRLFGIVWAKPH